MIRTLLALACACLASATPLLRHTPLKLNMLDGVNDYAYRLGIDIASLQQRDALSMAAQANGDYFFVQQNIDRNCEEWFAGIIYSTDVCLGTISFDCRPDDDDNDNDDNDDNDNGPDALMFDSFGRRLQSNNTGDVPVIQYYNPFLTANCTGEPDEEQEYDDDDDDDDNCNEFNAGGGNSSSGVWVSFACGVPDTGLLIIPDCEHDETDFLVAQIIATDFCFEGQEFSCGSDGSTIVTQFSNSDCTGQSRSGKVADPGECVENSTFVCLG